MFLLKLGQEHKLKKIPKTEKLVYKEKIEVDYHKIRISRDKIDLPTEST